MSRQTAGFLATLAALGVTFAYDYIREAPLFSPNPVLRDGWDLTQLDWLFLLSLALFAFYFVVPLVTHRRMTAHYWRQFRKNRAAVISLGYLAVVVVLGLVGPLVVTKPSVELIQSSSRRSGSPSTAPSRCSVSARRSRVGVGAAGSSRWGRPATGRTSSRSWCWGCGSRYASASSPPFSSSASVRRWVPSPPTSAASSTRC
nr:hypothetical protein [Halomicroarcula sp. SYNS111]